MNLLTLKSNKLYPPKKRASSELPMAATNQLLESLFPPTWRDKLVTASFRAVPFCVKKTSTSVGRRTKVYYCFPSEYIDRADSGKTIDKVKANVKAGLLGNTSKAALQGEGWSSRFAKGTSLDYKLNGVMINDTMDIYPYVADLGLEVLEYQIEGFLIANDYNDYNYLDHKKLLMAAFMQEGTGTLIHPFLGELDRAYVKGAVKFDEDFDEGGICRFNVTFQRGRENIYTNKVWTTKVSVKDVEVAAFDAWLMAMDKFASNIKTVGVFASSMITGAANLIRRTVTAVTNIAGAASSMVNNICNSIHTLADSLDLLLDQPCELARAFKSASDSMGSLSGLTTDLNFGGVAGVCSGVIRGETVLLNGITVPESLGISIVNQSIATLDFSESDLIVNNAGASTQEQTQNMTLVVNTGKAATITSLLNIVIRIDFTSQQKMLEILNKIVLVLDDFLLRLGENSSGLDFSDLYTYFDNLKNVFISGMISKNIGNVNEIDYAVPTGVTSSMVLAYDMYYNLSRSWEAQKRNEPLVRHPGFLPSGETIKILEA